jgi:ATP-dependent exoDNAse (exonuclease V) beta subunit
VSGCLPGGARFASVGRGAWDDGQLLTGFVDLVAIAGDRLEVTDFKTDAPPPGSVEGIYPEYAAQVGIYAAWLPAPAPRPARTCRARPQRRAICA